jgi:hypothetical protein
MIRLGIRAMCMIFDRPAPQVPSGLQAKPQRAATCRISVGLTWFNVAEGEVRNNDRAANRNRCAEWEKTSG